MQQNLEIISTKDGSHTLYSPFFDEIYHSRHGAWAESEHVFIKQGIGSILEQDKNKKTLHILEIGWGTGLNTLLTYLFWKKQQELKIFYTALEPFPVGFEIIKKLNYTESLDEKTKDFFQKIHQIEWNQEKEIEENFNFTKLPIKLEQFSGKKTCDIVYFDAFAPTKQSEMWETSNLKTLFDTLKNQGILVTYCAQGQFRRNIKAVGFEVFKKEGPPNKREMTYALKKTKKIV